MEADSYRTISGAAEVSVRERGSRFLAFAWPIADESEVKEHLEPLRKKYYDATHHCYAWRIGPEGELSRTNDDGEPSGTAGKPIMGQMLSAQVTNLLIVVVRYFGGTKLGVPGLINAYRESARAVIEAAEVVERTVDAGYRLRFVYTAMNDVMKIVKELSPQVVSQTFDNVCEMELSIRLGMEEQLLGRIGKCEGVAAEFLGYR